MPTLSGFSPLYVLLTVVAVAVTSLLIAYRAAGRRRSGTDVQPSRVPSVVVILALVSAVVTAVTTVVAAATAASAEQVSMTVPVQAFTLEPSPQVTDLDGLTATAALGPGFTEGTFVIEGLGADARAWLTVGILVNGAVLVLVLLAVALIARRARLSDPFSEPMSPVLASTGVLLAVGSVIWQICFVTASNLAATQLFGLTGWGSSGLDERELDRLVDLGLSGSGLPQPGFEFTIELWPIGIGLALIALAAVFRSGERLQHDAKGLV